jgi:hypothetical protein
MWADPKRVLKYESYFGPDVNAECVKIDAEQRLVAIRLTTGPKKAPPPPPPATPAAEPVVAAE